MIGLSTRFSLALGENLQQRAINTSLSIRGIRLHEKHHHVTTMATSALVIRCFYLIIVDVQELYTYFEVIHT